MNKQQNFYKKVNLKVAGTQAVKISQGLPYSIHAVKSIVWQTWSHKKGAVVSRGVVFQFQFRGFTVARFKSLSSSTRLDVVNHRWPPPQMLQGLKLCHSIHFSQMVHPKKFIIFLVVAMSSIFIWYIKKSKNGAVVTTFFFSPHGLSLLPEMIINLRLANCRHKRTIFASLILTSNVHKGGETDHITTAVWQSALDALGMIDYRSGSFPPQELALKMNGMACHVEHQHSKANCAKQHQPVEQGILVRPVLPR